MLIEKYERPFETRKASKQHTVNPYHAKDAKDTYMHQEILAFLGEKFFFPCVQDSIPDP